MRTVARDASSKAPYVGRLDQFADRARRLQAVNVIRRMPDGTFSGDNVDGVGFLIATASLRFDAKGRQALIIGCGGAGAIADALCQSGVAHRGLHRPISFPWSESAIMRGSVQRMPRTEAKRPREAPCACGGRFDGDADLCPLDP